MPEWGTYGLADFLLFSPRTYYRLFELYNQAVWPLHLAAIGLGAAILILWRRDRPAHGRAIAALLALCWAWTGWAYLLNRYDTINWAARYCAVGFVLQALLLAWSGAVRNRLRVRPPSDAPGLAGLGVFLFAVALYPAIAPLSGRPWAQAEVFGIAPDPTVIATCGVLAAARRPAVHLWLVPLIWCAFSGATLWAMQSPGALVAPAAALLSVALALWNARRPA